MTVVHPNHIVGINSITVQTGDSLSVHKADGSLIRTIVSNTGVSTFHAIEVSKGGGDLAVGVSTFFVDNSTGRIGIGTVAPARDMVHIHNPAANASSYIQFTNANTAGNGINDGTLIGISQNNSNTDGTGSGFTILQKENAEITLGTNNTERLRITSTGQVSISGAGTTFGNNTLLNIAPTNRTTAFAANDGDSWHDIVLKQTGDATTNAVGIAFEVSADAYHTNAGTGIACVKNGTDSDYGSDLVFITRPQSDQAAERLRIESGGRVNIVGICSAAGGFYEGTAKLATTGKAIAMAMIFG